MIMALLLVLVASALLAAGKLFTQTRLVIYIACVATLAVASWLFLTLVAFWLSSAVVAPVVYLGGGVLLVVLGATQWRSISIPGVHSKLSVGSEAVVLLAIMVVILGAAPILLVNGWHDGAWVMHGFYHGDTTTFVALVQKALMTQSLVTQNPFAGNGPLEYPTLLHASVAALFTSFGAVNSLLLALPWLTLGMIVITIPLLFLLWDVQIKTPTIPGGRWFGMLSQPQTWLLQLGLAIYVLTLSWDNFVYPQSHFFLTGIFLLAAAQFITAGRQVGRGQILSVALASTLVVILLWANAVTGTAALVMALAFYGWRVFDYQRPIGERVCYLAAIPAAVLMFAWASSGNSALTWLPQLSYTAAPDLLRLAVVVLPLSLAIFWHADRQPVVTVGVSALFAAALVTFFFSSRNIVVENASRFFYHGILVGWPLLTYPFVRGGVWLRRELLYTSRQIGVSLSLWVLTGILGLLVMLPALASGASTYKSLLRGEQTVVLAPDVAAYAWLDQTAGHHAIILAHPDSPWLVPLFTGRALLRTHYWLDPDDQTTATVTAAFAGNVGAQSEVLSSADFLVLTINDAPWPTVEGQPQWTANGTRIWQLNE